MGARIRRPSWSSPRSITRIWSPARHVFKTHSTVGLSLRGEAASLAGDGGSDLAGEAGRLRLAPCGVSRGAPFAEHASVDLLVDGVTRACGFFEPAYVEYRNVAPLVTNELATLQRAGRARDTDAPHAKHVGQEFVRDVKLVGVGAISGHQQPSCQPGFDQVIPRAGRRLHQLCEEDVEIAIQCVPDRGMALDQAHEVRSVDAPGVTRALDQRPQRRHMNAEQQWHAEHAFVSNEANLELRAIDTWRDQRDETVDGEVDVMNAITRFTQGLGQPEIDRWRITEQPRS